MAKYSDIKGFTVQTLSTDTVASQFAGGAWASGGAIPVNINSGVGFGTQTASVIGGGYDGSSYPSNVYEYDGSSWTSGGSLTASVGQARTGHGVLTAGGAVAGYKESGNAVIANYEQYDGTSFTEQNDLNTARQTLAAAGSTTAALAVGGTTGVGPGSTQTGLTNVESYNGSSWTETTENNTGRKQATSFSGGPAPTMIFIGGASGSTLYANVETYNGSAWTETTDLNTARSALAGAGQAQTDGLVFGGSAPSATAVTEQWNGTSWTELADLGTARHSLVGSGTGAASALAAGGGTSALTEEFTAPSDFNQIQEGQLFFNSTTNAFKETVQDVPTTAWASGANYPAPVYLISHFGTNTAALLAGGSINNPGGGPSQNAYTYDGASWSEIAELNSAHTEHGGFGRVTTGAVVGASLNELWDGSSWTESSNLNTGRGNAGVSGSSSSSGIVAAGEASNYKNTEIWDGSSWTEVNDMNNTRAALDMAGTTTSTIAGSGNQISSPPQAPIRNFAETWDGTSWTEVAELNTGRTSSSVAGADSSSAIQYGGQTAPTSLVANTELWNGSSWTELNDLSTATNRLHGGGYASSSAALKVGGSGPPEAGFNTVEEWTGPLANKTITSS